MDSLAYFNPDQLLTTFCVIDDLIMNLFETKHTVGRYRTLSLSEAATFSLIKARYGIQPLKKLYHLLTDRFSSEFILPSYKNFVESMNAYAPQLLMMIHILLQMKNKQSGVIKLVDSSAIPVCRNLRITTHRVMKGVATRSKTTTGWFYGLRLHAITDQDGHLLRLKFTTANVDDRKVLDEFLEFLTNSIIIADAGYLSPTLEKNAHAKQSILLTGTRKNMKKLVTPLHIFLLNLRVKIEHLFSVIKERYGLITSLPRSEKGYLAHYTRTIFGYLLIPLIS